MNRRPRTAFCLLTCCLHAPPQKLNPFPRDRFGRLLDIPPNRRRRAEVAEREAEAFDHQPAVVLQVVDGLKHRRPVDVPAARDAAIVLARVQVLEMRRRETKGVRHVLLFDIGVEGVKQQADRGMVDRVAELHAICGSVQEIRFETVERLECERHVVLDERVGDRLVALNRTPPLVRGPASAGQFSNRAVERADDQPRAGIGDRANRVAKVFNRSAPHVRAVADETEAADECRRHGPLQAFGIRRASNGGRGKLGRPEQRDLDAVESVRFDLRQQMEVAGPNSAVQMNVLMPYFTAGHVLLPVGANEWSA